MSWEKRVKWIVSGLLDPGDRYYLPFLPDNPHVGEACIRLINLARLDPRYMSASRCDEI